MVASNKLFNVISQTNTCQGATQYFLDYLFVLHHKIFRMCCILTECVFGMAFAISKKKILIHINIIHKKNINRHKMIVNNRFGKQNRMKYPNGA